MSAPAFAVVGHPNKGKSSLVATLARDLTVGISPEPGRTTRARAFPLRLDGETLYTLHDTPGFQRARGALEWMRAHEAGADSRPAVVEAFVQAHAGAERFGDECELLRPIIDGAGIIYVVDGAAPYGPEYEAEMEILRWTGRPSMAIINPIGEPRHVEPWERALGQFFRIVRVVDVLTAPFAQQIDLLRAFGQLDQRWRESLDRAVTALQTHRQRQQGDAARVIAELIAQSLTYQETKDIANDAPASAHTAALEERYRGHLRQLERRARGEVEAIFGYDRIESTESDLEWLESDLLSEESWLAFGLTKRDLIAVGAIGGAVAGGIFDVAALGTSFFAGSVVGGLAGGALAYFSSQKMAEVKILHQPLGGQRLRCGPAKSLQFPFVLLGRARLHYTLVAARTHARRDPLALQAPTTSAQLSEAAKRRFGRLFAELRRSTPGAERYATTLLELEQAVAELLDPPT